jgi:hypothetical protein
MFARTVALQYECEDVELLKEDSSISEIVGSIEEQTITVIGDDFMSADALNSTAAAPVATTPSDAGSRTRVLTAATVALAAALL